MTPHPPAIGGGTGAAVTPPPPQPAPRTRLAVLALLVVIGVGVHLWFIAGAGALDSDQALVLLMARRFAEGQVTPYFWQQNYMGVLEPLLLAPLAAMGWSTPMAAGLVALALTAWITHRTLAVCRALGGVPWLVLALWAVPPAVVVHHHVALYGARLAATALVVEAFARALRARSSRGWVTIGALLGAAFYGDHLMLPWAAGVAWLAVAQGRLGALALGAMPLVLADAAASTLTPAMHLAGPTEVGRWLATIPHLLGTILPQLAGLLPARGPGPVFETAAGAAPGTGGLWLLAALPGVATLGALARTMVRQRRRVGTAPEVEALVGVCLLQAGLFVAVGGDGERWPVRYLVPLWPALTVLAAVAASRWRPGRQPLALLLVVPALHTLVADRGWPPRGDDGATALAEARAVAEALKPAGVEAVWADYWDAYRLALLTGEPPRWAPWSVIDRRPAWRPLVDRADPVAYLVRHTDARTLGIIREGVAQGGVVVRSDRPVGRFQLVVTAGTVPGVRTIARPPARSWQRLAALAAAALFPGMLLAVAVAGRVARARSRVG